MSDIKTLTKDREPIIIGRPILGKIVEYIQQVNRHLEESGLNTSFETRFADNHELNISHGDKSLECCSYGLESDNDITLRLDRVTLYTTSPIQKALNKIAGRLTSRDEFFKASHSQDFDAIGQFLKSCVDPRHDVVMNDAITMAKSSIMVSKRFMQAPEIPNMPKKQ